MKTTGVRQGIGIGIMHSDLMDIVFHSVDACEVSAVIRSEWTKYCPMLNVWD